jgi:hypothetical protein
MAAKQPLISVEPVPPLACGQDAGGVTGDGDSGVRLLRLNNTQVMYGVVSAPLLRVDGCPGGTAWLRR